MSPGLFDNGGIARYGRYQLRALRELEGDRVRGASLLPRGGLTFADDVYVDHVGGGVSLWAKARYAAWGLREARPSALYWCGHLHLGPLGRALGAVSGGELVINVYGLEVWSCERKSALGALARARVVADCHATATHVVDAGLAPRERVHVIWDPVDARFDPGSIPRDSDVRRRYGLRDGVSFRVMFLGRLAEKARHKSPDALLRAFARARLPSTSELVIAGSGDREGALRALAGELGVAERTVFTGRVADEDLPGLYRSASLFVLVSRKFHGGGEGLPLTPIEAAACGAPIVVGNEDGSREAVVDGETGFLMLSHDDAELAALLERAARDPSGLREMGARAAADAARRFSYERFREEHRALLAEWMGAARPTESDRAG